MNETEIDEFMKAYYRSEPDPERLAEAVRYCSSSSFLQKIRNDPGALEITRFFFARIGIGNSSALRIYEQVFDTAPHEGRTLLLEILSCVGDIATKRFLQERAKLDSYRAERVEIERILTSSVPSGLAQ